jgi:hypothetical protein
MLPETLQYQAEFESQHKESVYEPGEDNSPFNLPFTLSELKSYLNARRDSATGKDVMFKHLPDSVLEIWLRLYNRGWSDGIYPSVW